MRYLVIIIFGLIQSQPAVAQDDSMNDLEEAVAKHQHRATPVILPTPVNHITPKYNRVTLAIDSQLIDTRVRADPEVIDDDSKLDLTGYVLSPYMALTLRSFGIGIAGEIGEKKASYQYRDRSRNRHTEESAVDYTGLGIYAYRTLMEKSNKYKLVAIGGMKMYNVKHEAWTYEGSDQTDSETIKYTLHKVDLGLNGRWQLNRDVAIVPWADLSLPNTNQVDDQVSYDSKSGYNLNLQYTHRYAADVELFWRGRPQLLYGLDVAVKHGPLEFHLGGGLGFLSRALQSQPKVDGYFIDESAAVSLALSYDFKGH